MIEIFLIILVILVILNYILKKKIFGLLKIITKLIELSNFYFSYKLNSKIINKVKNKKNKFLSSNDFAIIIQGPIITDSCFTLETLKYYSKQYPKSPIILSSWENDLNEIKKHQLDKNIHIVSNKIPSYTGIRNINLQSVSTKNAILYAKKLRCKYVLKTRSDTRVYFENFQNYLMNLIKFYKLKKKFKNQKARIVTTSFTLRYRMYTPSDLIMFGQIDDLYDYFNILTTKHIEKKFISLVKRLKFKNKSYYIQTNFSPENYFFYNFFKKKKLKIKWTVEDYIKKISENFIIIDNQTLNIYWKKSNRVINSFSSKPIASKYSLDFNFTDWLQYFYKNNKIKNL